MTLARQPLLHEATVVVRAPTQVWSNEDGSLSGGVESGMFCGAFHSDVRLVSDLRVEIGGAPGEHITTSHRDVDHACFVSLLRQLDAPSADPGIRAEHTRLATVNGVVETIVVRSHLREELTTDVRVLVGVDATEMDRLKAGLGAREDRPTVMIDGDSAHWGTEFVHGSLSAPGAAVTKTDDGIELRWSITIPATGQTSIHFALTGHDDLAVVQGLTTPAPWSAPVIRGGDERLSRWLRNSLNDLDGLRLTTTADPKHQFLAAGAPWFFTLFGRDSIWSARFLLPLGTNLARDTLRVLAGLQGQATVADSAEQPGKIMHELRRGTLSIPGEGITLPPLYYGTIDATPLWICLLYDAWRWGMTDDEVRPLIPHLLRALEWMRDFGDTDGDGLLEYVDESGHGLSNQGWKDSGDSVQWRDGTLAQGPIALCEVQAYAYEAAMHGAELLEHFGVGNPAEWHVWAANLKRAFAASFWIADAEGAYPAVALDAQKRPVDTVTSNLGHLLWSDFLTEHEQELIARRLISRPMSSGYGLRTMSTDSTGYWPLSYHGGSVWAHDTAVAIAGLTRAGYRAQADSLVNGLLDAAAGFGYRMPELHSGDESSAFAKVVPYPSACRPQAWAAAASVSVLSSVLGLRPRGDELEVSAVPGRSMVVTGLRFGGQEISINVNEHGDVTRWLGPVLVR